MAKTGAEIQKAYRVRKQESEDGNKRLDLWVTADTNDYIERLARLTGSTRQEVIEAAVLGAHRAAVSSMTDAQQTEYYRVIERKAYK